MILKNYSITLPSYSIGDNVYSKIGEICEPYGKKVICIGGKTAISKVRDLIINECNGTSLEILDFLWYGGDATYENVNTLKENELVKNVTSLLMELGTGFAFMGQQYHLEVGGKDFYIDLLFYNTKLRCYVAIDLKTGEFKPEQAGKMNFYLSALDDLVKAPEDNPSVGLILCRDENRTIAEYALRDMSKPIGVSEYHLCTDLPLNLKNALPAVEDIRSRIDMKK